MRHHYIGTRNKQQRIMCTVGTDGKVIAAKLQECSYIGWLDIMSLQFIEHPDRSVSFKYPWEEMATNEE